MRKSPASPVNNTCSGNSATYSSSTYSLTGFDGNLVSTDSFEFAYTTVTGDATIIARIPSSLSGTLAANGGVGLMMRTGINAGTRYTMIGVGVSSSNQKAVFRRRTTVGGSASSTYGSSFSAPLWFKLVRSGNSFSGYTAPDSSGSPGTWTQLGSSVTITATTMYAGFAVTPGSGSSCSTSVSVSFDNVSITTP